MKIAGRLDQGALAPLKRAYNDRSLTQDTRNELVKDYWHDTWSPRIGGPALWALLGKDGFPVDKEGMIGPLIKELKRSPALQQAVLAAADELILQRPIEQSWKTLVDQLGVEKTLKALSLIYAFYKWQKTDGLPAAFMERAHSAYNKTSWINQQRSADLRKGDPGAIAATHLPRVLVMNHGSSDAFDNNTHFFAHAWLTYRLCQLGYGDKTARQTSAFTGAFYEVSRDGSLEENHGNGAIKDVLMNAEGADFGVKLFHDAQTPLPGAYDGLPAEDKSI